MTYVIIPTRFGVLNVEMFETDYWGSVLGPRDLHTRPLQVKAREEDGGLILPDGRTFVTTRNRSIEWWPYMGISQKSNPGAHFPVRNVKKVGSRKKYDKFSSTYSVEGEMFDDAILEAYLSGILLTLSSDEKALIVDAHDRRKKSIPKTRKLKELEAEIVNDSLEADKSLGERYANLFPEKTVHYGPVNDRPVNVRLK